MLLVTREAAWFIKLLDAFEGFILLSNFNAQPNDIILVLYQKTQLFWPNWICFHIITKWISIYILKLFCFLKCVFQDFVLKLFFLLDICFQVLCMCFILYLLLSVFIGGDSLAHWGWDKMSAISQTTFSNASSWMKMLDFLLQFHWPLFPRVKSTIFQHGFRQWLCTSQGTSHYLNQWWLVYWGIYVSLGLNELTDAEETLQASMMSPLMHRSCPTL